MASRKPGPKTGIPTGYGTRWAILGASVVVGLVAQFAITNPKAAIVVGVVLVVLLGAGGLMCRGVGELRQSTRLKATGYFLGASAYVVTATVALVNGFRLL